MKEAVLKKIDVADDNKKNFFRVFYALFVRGFGVVIQFILSLVISHTFGAVGMGIFQIYTTWLVVLSDIASVGLPTYIMRRVSLLTTNKMYRGIPLFIRDSIIVATISSAVVCFPFLFFDDVLAELLIKKSSFSLVLQLAATSAFFMLLIRLISESLKAQGFANLGIFVESALVPLSVLVILFFVFIASMNIVMNDYIRIYVVASIICCICLFILWYKLTMNQISEIKESEIVIHDLPVFDRSILFIWFGMLLNIMLMNLPVLVMPYMAETEEIGLFSAASRLVMLCTTILVSLSALFGPQFVKHNSQKNVKGIKKALRQSQWYSLFIYFPFYIIFTLFSESILSVFGENFKKAKYILWILATAQLVNAATGLVGYCLIMINRERIEFYIQVVSVLIMLALIFILGKSNGVIGIATGYAVGIAIKNTISYMFCMFYIRKITKVNNNEAT